jgi:hypothetical protein
VEEKMDKKIVSYILIILGVVLIVIGTLNVAGFLNLQIVDFDPPKIKFIFPSDKMTYATNELTEIVVYAQDQSEIVSAVYRDEIVGTVSLSVTPYTKLRHPWVIQGWKYPDVNFDGQVDMMDVNLIKSLYGVKKTDTKYNPTYDLNSDGKIDMTDVGFASGFVTTVTFAYFITPPYSINENITFAFTVLDNYGNSASFSGWFTTAQFEPLSGKWKINGITISDNTLLEVSDRKITVTFTCNDISVSESIISVKATIGSTIHILSFIGNYTWATTIDLSPGENSLILEASTITPLKLNKISVTVKTPELPTFTIGHALIVVGGMLLVGGIIIVKKKEDIYV